MRYDRGTLLTIGSIVGLVSLTPRSAMANGRFPNADHLVVDPGDPNHIVVRATFGVVQTFDGGTTWVWLCEPAVGYGGTDDPAIAVTGLGNLLIGIRDGVATSLDSGCSWSVDGSALSGLSIADLATDILDPAIAIGISADDNDGNPRVVVAETSDNGASWTALGDDLGMDLFPQTLDAAPSMRERIYVSAVAGDQTDPVIERSSDRGESWTRLPVEIPDAQRTFISAISPIDPDVLYLRVQGEGTDRLFLSTDAAESFEEIAAFEGEMLGFALSPDGSKVAVGIKQGGVHVASTADHQFAQVNATGVRCLSWSAEGLYACGNEGQDGFTVARSTDNGATFDPLYHLLDLGLLECDAGTDAGDQCPALYSDLIDQLGNPDGSGGAGGSSSTISSSSSGVGDTAADGEDEDGCSCTMPRSSSFQGAALCVLGFAILGSRRRSRKRREFEDLRR